MLSDEEKEAIEWLKRLVKINKRDNLDNTFAEILLNLIEKQSKEIEELNLENIELKQSKIVDKNSIPSQDNFYDCYNFIHKDKIKAKIEEIQNMYDELYKNPKVHLHSRTEYLIVIGELQSLLEKEE